MISFSKFESVNKFLPGTDKLSAVRDTDKLNRFTLIILKFIFRLNHESINYARIFDTDYC